jgi:hypothetical protein
MAPTIEVSAFCDGDGLAGLRATRGEAVEPFTPDPTVCDG